MGERYDVAITISAAELEDARIERDHAARQSNCGCVVCTDQRYQRREKADAHLRAIEKAVNEWQPIPDPPSFTSEELVMKREDFLPGGALAHCTEAIQQAAERGVRELEANTLADLAMRSEMIADDPKDNDAAAVLTGLVKYQIKRWQRIEAAAMVVLAEMDDDAESIKALRTVVLEK